MGARMAMASSMRSHRKPKSCEPTTVLLSWVSALKGIYERSFGSPRSQFVPWSKALESYKAIHLCENLREQVSLGLHVSRRNNKNTVLDVRERRRHDFRRLDSGKGAV
jgi:hypothetical protein